MNKIQYVPMYVCAPATPYKYIKYPVRWFVSLNISKFEGRKEMIKICFLLLHVCAPVTPYKYLKYPVQRVSPWISQNRRREGDEQKRGSNWCMFARLLYSLKAYIRIVFSLTIYLKMRHEGGMSKNKCLFRACLRVCCTLWTYQIPCAVVSSP